MNNISESYAEFAKRIDCKFPYNDAIESSKIISEGRSICLDANFLVLKEICSKGRYEKVTRKRQRELVDEWSEGFDHPLKNSLIHCAILQIEGKGLALVDAIRLMKEISGFHAQYSALSIAYFSGEPDSDEGEAELEATYERIYRQWSEKAA